MNILASVKATVRRDIAKSTESVRDYAEALKSEKDDRSELRRTQGKLQKIKQNQLFFYILLRARPYTKGLRIYEPGNFHQLLRKALEKFGRKYRKDPVVDYCIFEAVLPDGTHIKLNPKLWRRPPFFAK